jgi:hypothetical protein
VDTLWPTLVQFLLRLSFGLALAMSLTPAQWVTSGYYRVHLWVIMGMGTFASLASYSYWSWYVEQQVWSPSWLVGACIAMTVLAYIGAVIWMYELIPLGKAFLLGVALCSAVAAFAANPVPTWQLANYFAAANWLSSSCTLGFFLASMFLGHWYLNWPGMKLHPLQRLVILCGIALVIRTLFAASGWLLNTDSVTPALLVFRWLAGIVGPAVMAYMAWQTLKIPNTQSATGILYAAVILTFLGELTSQLLSRPLPFPV